MSPTRRRYGLAMLALAVTGGLAWTPVLAERKPRPHDDDDDAPSLPNIFYSPCGKPFRAEAGEPYPVVEWFKEADKNGDGKLDHTEFLADAEAFFNVLDINKDGYLSRYEIQIYERKVAPEILVGTAHVGLGPERDGARLWLAQVHGGAEPIDPSGDHVAPTPAKPGLDESGQGASPYGLFEEPEPVMTADLDVNGIISKANFLRTADMHFTALDQKKQGYLTLAGLPKTIVQKALERAHKGRRKA